MLCQVLGYKLLALQNLTAGKVIIIHPYVYRLYWYLEAYNVISAIAFCNTLVVECISACPLYHEQPGSNPGTTGHLSFFPARVSYKTLNSLIVEIGRKSRS